MSDSDPVVRFIDDRIEGILERPGLFGDYASAEASVLTLIEARAAARAGYPSAEMLARLLEGYKAFIRDRVPGCRSLLGRYLNGLNEQDVDRDERFVDVLGEFYQFVKKEQDDPVTHGKDSRTIELTVDRQPLAV